MSTENRESFIQTAVACGAVEGVLRDALARADAAAPAGTVRLSKAAARERDELERGLARVMANVVLAALAPIKQRLDALERATTADEMAKARALIERIEREA